MFEEAEELLGFEIPHNTFSQAAVNENDGESEFDRLQSLTRNAAIFESEGNPEEAFNLRRELSQLIGAIHERMCLPRTLQRLSTNRPKLKTTSTL